MTVSTSSSLRIASAYAGAPNFAEPDWTDLLLATVASLPVQSHIYDARGAWKLGLDEADRQGGDPEVAQGHYQRAADLLLIAAGRARDGGM